MAGRNLFTRCCIDIEKRPKKKRRVYLADVLRTSFTSSLKTLSKRLRMILVAAVSPVPPELIVTSPLDHTCIAEQARQTDRQTDRQGVRTELVM